MCHTNHLIDIHIDMTVFVKTISEVYNRSDSEYSGAREGSCGQLVPLKFGTEVRNCIWRFCRTGVKVMAIITCLTSKMKVCFGSF